ncbi:TetR/AcrR family transcriptional regulator [Nocardia sp. bgisy118]|uniref:TetR/AcrR family transcriptional regulator n=1 Tax=Nocardia sp. bgisy118 TaxID=3413786 RepID=UPI003F4A4313
MAGRAARSVTSIGSDGETATPPRRTQQERTAQAEQALLDAAETLFAQRGVDQTSLADVGQLAGYSRGLASHHFGSKAALVDRLAQRIQERFVTEAIDVADIEGTDADAVEILAGLVEDYLKAIVRHSQTGRAFFVMWGAAIPSEATMRPVFATDDARFRLGAEALLRAGQANGTVDGDIDPVATAVAVIGMVRGVAAQHLIAPDAFDLNAAAEACRQFVRKSLTPAANNTHRN